MNSSIRAVTVYSSSSNDVAPAYFDVARQLGSAIASHGWKLVYGGNNVGLMGAIADAVRAAGGKVIGVTPQIFIDHGLDDRECEELLVTACMRTRKAAMEERGDAFIALPGGLGTFEELFEIIVGRQLGFHTKPIVLIDVDDYWRPFVALIEQGIEQKFILPRAREYLFVAPTVAAAIEYLKNFRAVPHDARWLTEKRQASAT